MSSPLWFLFRPGKDANTFKLFQWLNGEYLMKKSVGNAMFELTAKEETICYKELEAYFSQMFFAN
jgi:regulatory protein YycI of two-component signal transduction system YycFG